MSSKKVKWISCDPSLPVPLKFDERYIERWKRGGRSESDLPTKLVSIERSSYGTWVLDEWGNPMPWRVDYWRCEDGIWIYLGL